MKNFLCIIFFLFLYQMTLFSDNIHPPGAKLNIPPPLSKEEAIERIDDYKKLLKILPPNTDKAEFEKSFFGKYVKDVKKYLTTNENFIKNTNSFTFPEKQITYTINKKHNKDKVKTIDKKIIVPSVKPKKTKEDNLIFTIIIAVSVILGVLILILKKKVGKSII